MKELGQALAKLRRERNLGQKELASLLNMSIGTISNYEKGIHSPDLTTLCRLADFFNVTTDYLLGRSGYRCPPEVLDQYITSDYTVSSFANTILSLDSTSQNSVIDFTNFLKNHNRGQ